MERPGYFEVLLRSGIEGIGSANLQREWLLIWGSVRVVTVRRASKSKPA